MPGLISSKYKFSKVNRSLRTLLCLAIAHLELLGGCSNPPSTIAVIPRTTATLLWEPLHLGAAEAARGSGLHIYWNAPVDEGDIEKQLSFISAARTKNYRGIIFAPDETLASRSVVLQAVANHIPVVIVDDELGPPPGRFLSYVTNDESAGALLAAKRLTELLHGHGSIAIIGISPRLESGLSREEEFESALAVTAPGIRVAVRRFGDSVVTHQQQIAQETLEGSERIDAIVTLTATATRGAFYAKMAAETHSSIPIVGFDQGSLLPVQTGSVDSVIIQNTREIGRVAMQNIQAQVRGESVNGLTKVPPILVTHETLNSPQVRRLWEFTDFRWSEQ
jgi:ribose transport system substrate-binding protein